MTLFGSIAASTTKWHTCHATNSSPEKKKVRSLGMQGGSVPADSGWFGEPRIFSFVAHIDCRRRLAALLHPPQLQGWGTS